MDKIKVLVITYLPWRDDNNIGNSYSNIFKGTESLYEFAHIYIRDGIPQNKLVHEYYHISEIALLRRFFLMKEPVGRYFHLDSCDNMSTDTFGKAYNKARLLRWNFFFFIRDLIGYSTSWKTKEFDDFLDKFNPDLIFGTLPTAALIYRLMVYCKRRQNIPLVTYPWDDYYLVYKNNYSPLYWLRKLMIRRYLKKSANESAFLYTISDVMRIKYEQLFGKECKLLYKGYVFNKEPNIVISRPNPIRLVYTGNIGSGRWKTLAHITRAAQQINNELGYTAFEIKIYTLSPISTTILGALNVEGTSRICGSIPNNKVPEIIKGADVLIHAEPFNKKDYQLCLYSFSTKLVDYFYAGKCILAVGYPVSSIDYLQSNDAAICITDFKDIKPKLWEIFKSKEIISEYDKKSWDCGRRNHQIVEIQESIYKDFKCLVKK